jgi:hypothetical protein
MVIMTDGDIHDIKETTDIIVELSKFPVSIIIIGVGDEDFERMEFLDSDDKVLRNSRGQPMARDIVQFVRFKDHKDACSLAEDVLRELPEQMVNYMLSQGIKPKK